MLFAINLELNPGEDMAMVTARAEDREQRTYPLVVEYIGHVPQAEWLTQVVINIPDELANAGDIWISVKLRGATSNRVMVKIRP